MKKGNSIIVVSWVLLMILCLTSSALNVYEPDWRYWYLSLFSVMALLGMAVLGFILMSIQEVMRAVKRWGMG